MKPKYRENFMDSKVKFLGHPVHPMLVVFPLGLLATAAVFDVIALSRGVSYLFSVSYWMIVAGLAGGLVSAIFGLIDWIAIPNGTRAKSIGLWHGGGNFVVIVLFAVSWWLRRPAPDTPPATALALSVIGVIIALVTAWLGGELVDRLGVGVDAGANLNAPNSLSKRPASQEEGEPEIRRVA
jgi:uncharacterized membrane protein